MLQTDLAASRANREPTALSEIALTGVYENTKILTSPARLEATLANVLNLLSTFMQMRDGVIALLDDDGTPDIVVGAGWCESSPGQFRPRIPEKAVGPVVPLPVVAPPPAQASFADGERVVVNGRYKLRQNANGTETLPTPAVADQARAS
jgi:transcriptional regulator with GAF, ATPase, and Fis domain